MKDLSIIIRADEKDVMNYLEVLRPLFLEFKIELIIVSDQLEIFDIPFKHTVCNYSGDYHNFKKFCFASSLGEKIIIIEKSLKLSSEFIHLIKNELVNKDYSNITFKLKTYLSEDQLLFFTCEKVFVYNRGIVGFNKYIDMTVEDYRLIHASVTEIKVSISWLITEKYFKELYIWHENFIEKKSTDFLVNFYIQVEKTKLLLEDFDLIKLEALFIRVETDINPYLQYLELKKRLRNRDNECYKNVMEAVQFLKLTEKESYYSWLIRDFIIAKIVPSFISQLDVEIRDSLFNLLFEEDEGVFEYFYEFIMSMNATNKRLIDVPNEYTAYVYILKVYIHYIVDHSKDFSEKERLLEVFDLYLDYCDPSKGIMSSEEVIFVRRWGDVKHLIENGKIDGAIGVLESMRIDYPKAFRVIHHYIHKIRNENNCFQYVLSICMIVKNEEKNLNRCLLSVQQLVHSSFAEIIIVDTGSTDDTLKIAKAYTNKIFCEEWKGNFSDMRNLSVLYAQGQFILILDADEAFKEGEINKIITEFSSSVDKNYNTFTLKIKSFTDIEYTKFSAMTQQRIFRNDGDFYYESAVHNQPEFKPLVKNLDVEVLHYGYIMTEDIKDKKFLRTTTLLKNELQKDPRNIYYRYQLSSSYAMHSDLAEALNQVDIMVRLIKESRKINTATLMYYNNAVAIYLSGGRYKDAEVITNEALSISPNFIDFIYYQSIILFRKKKYEEALLYINEFLILREDYFKLEVANNDVFAFYTIGNKDEVIRLFILSNFRLKRYETCLEKIYLIEDYGILKNCLHEIVAAYFYSGQYWELEKFYKFRVEYTEDQDFKSVFMYFFMEHSAHYSQEELGVFLIELRDNQKSLNKLNCVDLISKYDIDFMDLDSAVQIFLKIIPLLKAYPVQEANDAVEISKIKKATQAILHRTEELCNLNLLPIEELVNGFNVYINLCIRLINLQNTHLLEAKEVMFISKITLALNKEPAYAIRAIQYLEDAILDYLEMGGITRLIINRYFSHNEERVIKTNSDKKNIKVLHGAIDLTNKTIDIVKALKHKGIYAKGLNYLPDYCLELMDYQMDINVFDNEAKMKNSLEVTRKLVSEFDIFHFHYLTTLTLDYSDLALLREGNKKMFMHCWGQDVRLYSKARLLNPYIPNIASDENAMKRDIEKISKFISCCIISDYELNEYVKDFFQDIKQVNRMIDLEKYTVLEFNRRKKFTIVHVVTSPELQGTQQILSVIEKIKDRYDIDFKLVQDISKEKELKLFKEADLIIDQILIGSYSQLAIEAMAMGKPVMCFITDFMKEKYPKELPLIITSPDDIEEKLAYILDNRDMLKDIGIQGRRYVEKYHDIEKEIDHIIKLYMD